MTEQQLRDTVRAALTRVAPESAGLPLRGDDPVRERLDLDSMDFLQFVIGLHRALGVDIPEADYPQLATLDGAVAYLSAKFAG